MWECHINVENPWIELLLTAGRLQGVVGLEVPPVPPSNSPQLRVNGKRQAAKFLLDHHQSGGDHNPLISH
jgi:hypothetical protein